MLLACFPTGLFVAYDFSTLAGCASIQPCPVLLCVGAPNYMCVRPGVSLRPGVFWLVASCLFLVLVFAPLQDPLMRTNSPVGGNAAFVKKRATGSAKAPLSVGVFEDDGGVVVGMS